jgi:hypothetical protein
MFQADHPAPDVLMGRGMNNKLSAVLAAVLAAFLFSACAVESTDESQTGRTIDEDLVHIDELELELGDEDTQTRERAGADQEKFDTSLPLCERIVETEGACAVACDEEALQEYIPQGACVLYPCTLDDGRRISVGGCRY